MNIIFYSLINLFKIGPGSGGIKFEFNIAMKLPVPKGILVPIGGGEDKKDKRDVLSRVLAETGKKKPSVCVITVATDIPKEVGNDYKEAFKGLGVKKIDFIHFESRQKADKPVNFEKIKKSDVVLFSGGNQLKLSSLVGGTRLLDLVRQRYYDQPNFVIAGTSAGAAAMSDTMIIAGSSQDALIKGELELTNGLDFINSVFIDTHFTERGRFGRLVQTVTCNPGVLGVGLGEDTALVIYRGDEVEVIGSGLVVIVDGHDIEYTDLTKISDGDPITVAGLRVHVLGHGKKFNISRRKVHENGGG
jgi:cyanophycinase